MASLFRDTAHSGPRRRRAHGWAYLRIALAMALAFLMLPSAGMTASAEEPAVPDSGATVASTSPAPEQPGGETDGGAEGAGDGSSETPESEQPPAEKATEEDPTSEQGEQPDGTEPADETGEQGDSAPAVEKAEPKVQKSAPAPQDEKEQDAPRTMTAMASGSGDATITVKTGGTRTGATTVAPLAGVKLRLQESDGDAIGESWAACTSQANGSCTFTVPKKEIDWFWGTEFRVAQVAAPSGWYQNGSLLTGERSFSATEYAFPVQVYRGGDYLSTVDFMKAADNSNGEWRPDRDASNGIWQDSRNNPTLSQRCVAGLDVALVLDRSGSVAPYLNDLKQSAKGFVDALAGTGSAVALYSFGEEATKDRALTELDAGSNLQVVKSKIDDYSARGATNWDRGLWQVAADPTGYDLTIVITDGNPTVYGAGKGPGDFTSFKEMEEAIFSANAIKAEGTRLLAVGVGDGVSGSGANLRAVSGPTKANGGPAEAADYFQTDWNNLAALLDDIAAGYTCEAAITVQKRTVTPGGNPAGTPAAGWQFTAQVTDGPAVLDGPATTTTGADGTTKYWLEYAGFTDEADVRITEASKPDWNIDRAVCKVNGTAVATPLNGTSFSVKGIGREDSVDCVVYNVQEPAPSIEVTKTASPGQVPETGGPVTYTVKVKNTSGEQLRLTSLTDDIFGNLFAGLGNTQIDGEDCQSGRLIGAGASYTCSFQATLTGDAGDEHTNVVTAVAVDDDGTSARDHDDATVTFTDVAPTVKVTKSAAPGSVPESGGDVRFTVGVKNTSHEKVWLTDLVDDPFGDLLDDAGNDQISGSTCVAAAAGIAPGATYTCAFTAHIGGLDAGDEHVDTVTGTVEDNDGSEASDSAQAKVTVTDVPPTVKVTKTAAPVTVPETGGSVLYTVDVKNTSFEPVTLQSLVDDKFGDLLDVDNDAVETSTCTAGTAIASGATYSCSFTADLTGLDAGDRHVNVVTATVMDDDESTATDRDDATVTATDVKPAIEVTKTADPGSVFEPGAEVTYTVTVDNTGPEEVALTDLVDDMFGDLFEGTDPAVSQSTCEATQIAGLGSYTCEFDAMVTGDAGDEHVNVVTATAYDNEENEVTDSDDATVTITDVKPVVTTLKTADPTSVDEPGDEVTYTVSIANESTFEAVELSSLLDTMYDGGAGFGDLLDPDNDLRGNTCNDPREADDEATVGIEPGGSYDCTFTALVEGDAGDTHHNVVTAVVVDDGDEITTFDDAEVKVEDVLPTIEVTKDADPVSVPEPSAEVSYRVSVENTSPEPVALTDLVDSEFGDLFDDAGNDLVSGSTCEQVVIPAGVTYQCGFEAVATGDVGVPHVNTVTATGYDNEENSVSDSDTATVEFTDVLPTVEVTKTADVDSVPESGGPVTYTVEVHNTSPEELTLMGISDDRFGNLLWGETEGVDENLCLAEAIDRRLAPDETVTCTFTARIAGNAGTDHTNVVTVRGMDNEENSALDTDDETVGFTDVLPTVEVTKTADVDSVPESGGAVTYDVTVANTSWESVTLTDLVDDMFGDLLDGENDAVSSSSCEVGEVIAADTSYTCSFTATIAGLDAGDEHVNTVTGTVVDDDDSSATDEDRETVEITDVEPTVEVTKSATSAVREPGGMVSYVVSVENTSWEPVTLTDLVDDKFGDLLDGENDAVEASTCEVGVEIASGDVYTCTFDAPVTGNAGFEHTNVVTATVVDNDDSTATDDDDATVTVSDEAPIIDVTKAAGVASVPETGADVTYTVGVRNDSVEPVTLTSLVDDRFGDLLDDEGNDLVSDSTCVAGSEIAVGATYTCTFDANVSGNAGVPHVNVVTGIAVDDEGGEASDVATATVGITDVAPEIELTKTADVDFLDAPGGAVTYTVAVENTGSEAVSLVSLVDDRFGDLLGGSDLVLDSTCVAGTTIEVGETYACTFTADVLGTAGFHVNVVTGTVVDDDGTEAVDSDDESVAFNEVLGVEEERPAGERPERPTPGALRPATGILPETGSGRAVLGLGLLGSLMVAVGAGTVLTRRRRSI